MRRQTKLCIDLGGRQLNEMQISAWIDAGVDAIVLTCDSPTHGDWVRIQEIVRRMESAIHRPIAFILNLPRPEMIEALIASGLISQVEMLAVSADYGGVGIETLRKKLPASCEIDIIAKFDSAKSFQDIDRIVQAADAAIIEVKGLQRLPPSESPVAQKQISRQCQTAAKPCLIQRESLESLSRDPGQSQPDIFDLANVVFDHADGVLLSADAIDSSLISSGMRTVQSILHSAETYLEVTDRPVRVGFGQPPNTAALAYAIRHILKMQEIAAVAVYSISGTTARVISKNWLDTPIIALSPKPTTARRMVLYHGVTSRLTTVPEDASTLLKSAGSLAKELGIALPGDRIIVVSGHPNQTQDQANGFAIETVSD